MHSETCPICDGPSKARPAVISPFIVERCNLETAATLIRYCAACDFAFFDRRLAPDEAAALYNGYRGADYDAQRLRLEPSYAPYIPLFEDRLSEYYRRRVGDLLDVFFLLPEIEPASVLDFGGDGDIAARLFPNAEISFLDASAGENLSRERFDLVIASQVFEHLTDPREAINRIAGMLEPGGLLLLDLPRDYDGALAEALPWQEKHGGPLMVMHEHINHFSMRAIRRLLATAGLVSLFEVQTPYLPLTLSIAGRADAPLAQRLMEVAPARKLQWTADVIRRRQASELALSAERLAAAQGEAARLATELASATAELAAAQAARQTLSAQVSSAQAQLTAAQAQLTAAELSLQESRAAIAALHASASWRLSGPLRGMSRLAARGRMKFFAQEHHHG